MAIEDSRPWVHRTAFGVPVVPEVNSNKKRSAGLGPHCWTTSLASAPKNSPRRSAYSGLSITRIRSADTPMSRPANRDAPSVSVTRTAQSVRRMSPARASPRRVELMPTTTARVKAAAPSQNRNSGTLPSRMPTWGGPTSARWPRSSSSQVARAADAPTTSSHVHRSLPETTATWSSPARAQRRSAMLGVPSG